MNRAELERQYREQHFSLFEALASRIAALLQDLLHGAQIDLAQLECRAKTVESFLGKVERKGYKDPFTEIKDLAGLRVITYYNDDVQRVADLIHAEFDIDPAHSTDKLEELGVDEFGYRSFHIVATLAHPRSALPEWKDYVGRPFEIQVRSVLQHAWAAISHKIDYKTAAQAPKELRRELFRLSALLELADDEFASVRDKSKTLVEGYRQEVDRGQLDLPLNLSSLTEFLSDKVDLNEWKTLGMEVGMGDSMHEADEMDTQNLFDTLHVMNVATVAEFDQLLKEHRIDARQPLNELVEAVKERNGKVVAVPIDVINLALALCEKHRLPKSYRWPKPWTDEIQETMNVFLGLDEE